MAHGRAFAAVAARRGAVRGRAHRDFGVGVSGRGGSRGGADAPRPGRGPREGAARDVEAPAAPPSAVDPWLLAILAAAAALWLCFLLRTRIRLEDALITYRYAENLARGAGIVFSPGERVQGTTTPLLTLMLGGLGATFGPARIPVFSNALMLVAALVTGWLLHDVVRRGTGSRGAALAAAALWAASPETLWTSTGGMETPLVVMLMVASLDLAMRGRWGLAGAAAGALTLARADGLVWTVLLLAFAVVRLRRGAWRPALIALLVIAPWVAFAWLYFGSPIPHAILAKREIGLGAGSVKYLPWLLDSLGFSFSDDLTPVEFALWLVFVLLGATALWARDGGARALRLLTVFPPAFACALAAGRAPWFPWYLVPVTWCGLVLGVLGARELRAMLRVHARTAAWPRATVTVLTAFCALVLALGLGLRDAAAFSYWSRFQQNEDATRARIGLWIASHTKPDAVVAMEAIGYEGTLSHRRVIDLAGVVSPGVVSIQRGSHSNAEAFARVLNTYQPDVVVLRTFEVDSNRHRNGGPLFETTQARADFLSSYARALQVEAPHRDIWQGNASITVWRRTR